MSTLDHIIVPVTPFVQNCSVLICKETKEAAIVDPGGDLDLIVTAVSHLNARITKILVTHGHADHAGAVGATAAHYNVPIIGPHADDLFWIDSLREQGARFGLTTARPFVPDVWLSDGDRVEVGTCVLQVLHCPGHTPGHVVFYHPASNLAVVGDVIFQGSIGRTDFPRGDHDTLIRSIRNHLFLLPEETTFIPGHGPKSTFAKEKKTNPFVGDHLFPKETH
jgi:hydroxyacylglutathione hydrolase